MGFSMVIEQQLHMLLQGLVEKGSTQILMGSVDITVSVAHNGSQIRLSTPVYSGGNYIPGAVRKAIFQPVSFSSRIIQTHFTVDEDRYEIYLNYQGSTDRLDPPQLKTILEEFAWLADEWRLYLDDRDYNDRIHISVK